MSIDNEQRLKELKDKEWQEWCLLYEYVKKEILQYDEDMKVPQFMVLRLRGLRSGKFMSNKTQKSYADYGFDVILLTFKACKMDILKYTKQNIFKDEQHKFNYIMVIIENNINDIVLRLKNRVNQDHKIETFNADQIKNENVAGYTRKTKDTKSKLLDDLW